MNLYECATKPSKSAAEQDPGIWLVLNGEEVDQEATLLEGQDAVNAVPKRFDLDPSHPMYGKRVLKNVHSGYPDVFMSPTGNLSFTEQQAPP